jgi:hypothetical protein
MYKLFSLILFISIAVVPGFGQRITAIENTWPDSFKEWTLYTEGDSLEGSWEMLWQLENDWSEWTFELGDLRGQIKQKFNNPGFWEFRAGDEIVTAKILWAGDFGEWRFSDGTHIIKLKSKYYDIPWLWFSKGEDFGYIDIYREYENDPKLWLVEDFLSEEISTLYRIAMIFISIYHSSPKY